MLTTAFSVAWLTWCAPTTVTVLLKLALLPPTGPARSSCQLPARSAPLVDISGLTGASVMTADPLAPSSTVKLLPPLAVMPPSTTSPPAPPLAVGSQYEAEAMV